jgi:hypothetical protein
MDNDLYGAPRPEAVCCKAFVHNSETSSTASSRTDTGPRACLTKSRASATWSSRPAKTPTDWVGAPGQHRVPLSSIVFGAVAADPAMTWLGP